ncbi:zinc ribbon domain-containing protein [Methanobrevibacter sp.]|uniref:zinc ribbon domain-containing protein n=1 Tax=Methanobrevibacter sp. TaxID=66852 RepID=UPI0026DF60A1|nr:zinc ribbon domain-containing protein [Methanobrevibacter sp.]MDO5860768.1 zinc ribbon domain-containing protein [Methanobrevibacter sp.]
MRSCDVCGTLNFKENNYCIHCGNKLVEEHICPYCGESNLDIANHCINCGSQINPITIDDFDILFNDYNNDLLLNAKISNEEYMQMLSTIFARAKYSELYGNTTKNKIINLANVFTQCKPKARGFERGYIFLDNCIYYDDRLEDSIQIATIIHELAHYLLYDIIESLLCKVFNVRTSSTIQSFVWYFLTLPEFKIMNEYCAHTVEGRFIPYGYQNYGSFNNLIEQLDYDKSSLNDMIIFGNTFANEIIIYLEKYIDENLREEIKLQYRKDLNSPNNDSLNIETNDCLSLDMKNSLLLKLLYDILKIASKEDVREELEIIKEGIEAN